MTRPLRIAQVVPPIERVPPRGYGGTERVVFELVRELDRRGHHVTTFASGDSDVPGRLVPTVPEALRPAGFGDDVSNFMNATILDVLDRAHEFDIIHSHLEWSSILFSRSTTVPVAATFHGRLDLPWARSLLHAAGSTWLVAISESQPRVHPDVEWTVVHNGLTLSGAPFERRRSDELCFIGRVAPEKGVVDAIDIAIATGRHLKIAAKIGPTPGERQYDENVFRPALKRAGSLVEYVGEVSGEERDAIVASSYATLMPGSWPEPFGLVAIESLACGTPVLARRVGGLPEIIREGIDGFFGDDVTQLAFSVGRVAELDREAIRASVIERFSAARMTDGYEALYQRMLSPGLDVPVAREQVVDMAARRTGAGAAS
jgi:glycosyltransferase involved in cell wall biosynthesis